MALPLVVQSATPVAAYQTSPTTITFSSATTAGNCIVVAAGIADTGATSFTISGVTLGGSAGNFAQIYSGGTVTSADNGGVVWWADPNCAGGQTAVAVTISSTTNSVVILYAYEVSGLATTVAGLLDQSTSSFGASTTTFNSGASGATSQPNEIAFGMGTGFNASSVLTMNGPASPWVNQAQENLNPSGSQEQFAISGYQILTATGTVTYSGTFTGGTSGGWAAGVITLLPAPPAVPAPPQPGGQTWNRHFRRRQRVWPSSANPPPSFTAPSATEGNGTLSGIIAKGSAGVSTTEGSGTLSGAIKKNITIVSTIEGSGALAGGIPPPFDQLPSAPLFPAGYTNAMVELDLSGTWTDVTPYTFRTPLTITRGHADESTTTAPSQCTGSLTNEDGRFASKNPLSPYYGSLMRNVPMRVSLPEGASYLRIEQDQVSYAQCPTSAGVSITGDMDVQLDLTLDNWRAAQILAAKYAQTGNERSWKLLLEENGNLAFVFSSNGTAIAGATNSSVFGGLGMVPPPPLGRLCIRVTFQASTGTVKFYTAPAGNLATASWTVLGDTAVFGSESLFACTAPVQVGWCSDDATDDPGYTGIYGKIHAFRLLSGIGGTVEASPDFTVQTPGAASFADAQGNTWTLEGTSAISNRKYRFHGELAVLPQQWTPTFRQAWSDFTAAGVLRRLAQGTNPLNSAMYRAYVRLPSATQLAAYWPAEDTVNSTSIASAIGGSAMSWVGTPTLASSTAFACSAALPVMNGATISGAVPANSLTWNANVVRFLWAPPSGGETNGAKIVRAYTTGTIKRVELTYGTGGTMAIGGYDGANNQLFTSIFEAFGLDGGLWRVSMELTQSGSNVTWGMVTVAPGASSGLVQTGTLASATVGAVTSVQFGGAGLNSSAMGHFSVQATEDSVFTLGQPLNAWIGETAGNRMLRLCGEEGIAFRSKGRLSTSALMGAQTLETLPDLLQECADTDRGVIFEPRQVLGLGYRCVNSLEGQAAAGVAPAVAWDFNQNEMDMPSSWPVEDDQRTVNDVTVTSATGSSSHQVLATGPISILLPPNGVGRYAQSYTVNPDADSQLPSIGGWILHVGSVNEPRYPSIAADLANTDLSSALFYAILDADLGDLVSGANPPAWLPPGPVRQIIQGTTETIFVKQLTVDWAAVPASPYDIAVVSDAVYGHLDTGGSQLTTGISSSAASMSVTTTAGTIWTTSAGDFPFDVGMGGERITVTNITGASSPQTFTITRSVNGVVKAQTAGTAIALWNTPVLGL